MENNEEMVENTPEVEVSTELDEEVTDVIMDEEDTDEVEEYEEV